MLFLLPVALLVTCPPSSSFVFLRKCPPLKEAFSGPPARLGWILLVIHTLYFSFVTLLELC